MMSIIPAGLHSMLMLSQNVPTVLSRVLSVVPCARMHNEEMPFRLSGARRNLMPGKSQNLGTWKTGACQRGARRSFFTLFSVSRERGFQSFPWSNHMYITTKFFEVPFFRDATCGDPVNLIL